MNNTVTRSISGILFLLIMVGSLLWGAIPFAIVIVTCIVIMMSEYFRMTMGSSFRIGQLVAYLLGIALFITTFLYKGYGLDYRWIIALTAFLPLLHIAVLFRGQDNYSHHPYLLCSIIYIALPFSLINLIIFNQEALFSANLLLTLFIFLWTSDVGAYLFGICFGQRFGKKLFPSISPKKSWVGYFGGVLLTLISSIVIYYTRFIDISLTNTILIALIINIFSVFGDLSESQLKRFAGVKDSGAIMPGHGGLLDRFDGVLLSFPPAIIYLILFTDI